MSVNECFSAIFFARRVETAWRNLEQSLFSLVVLMNTMINSFWLVCEIFFSLVFESSAERRTRGFDRLVLLARGTTLLGLLRQQDGVNVRQDTAGRDGDGAQKLGQFLVVANGELDVARHDARLFVIARGVTREFEHFSREVFLRTSNTNQTHPSVTSSSFHPTPRVTELERLSPPPRLPRASAISKTHHDSRHVHRRTGTDARGVLASLQVSRDATDRELQPSLGGSAHRLLASLSFTSSGHRSSRASRSDATVDRRRPSRRVSAVGPLSHCVVIPRDIRG